MPWCFGSAAASASPSIHGLPTISNGSVYPTPMLMTYNSPRIPVSAYAAAERAVVLGAALHAVLHRGDEGVAARADVLKIEDDGVEVLQRAGRRAVRLAVERIENAARSRVFAVFDFRARVLIAVDPVLRAEER